MDIDDKLHKGRSVIDFVSSDRDCMDTYLGIRAYAVCVLPFNRP